MCSRFRIVSSSVFRAARRLGKSKNVTVHAALLAAAGVAGLSFSKSAIGAVADVTSIQTQLVTGSTTTVTSDKGGGNSSGFTSGHSYTMKYLGDDVKITKVTAGSSTYVPTAIASTVIDRGSGPNNDTIFYQGSGTYKSTTLDLESSQATSVANAFSGNNLDVGADNIFANTGNNQANDTNIERLDFIFNGGISASESGVFSILERGFTNQHDGFKIAAITGLDQSGNPSNYGPVLTFGSGTYGKTAVVSNEEYLVTRKNDSKTGDVQHPSDEVIQPIGGVVIPTSSLVSTPGEEIFGYSLFATDVTGTGTNLVNWKNTTYFPSNTAETIGGMDLLGTAAVLYTPQNNNAAIPEPATGALALIWAAGLIARRPKHRRA
jgi:hypothetical protein